MMPSNFRDDATDSDRTLTRNLQDAKEARDSGRQLTKEQIALLKADEQAQADAADAKKAKAQAQTERTPSPNPSAPNPSAENDKDPSKRSNTAGKS